MEHEVVLCRRRWTNEPPDDDDDHDRNGLALHWQLWFSRIQTEPGLCFAGEWIKSASDTANERAEEEININNE